jgi:hypothetical protein
MELDVAVSDPLVAACCEIGLKVVGSDAEVTE